MPTDTAATLRRQQPLHPVRDERRAERDVAAGDRRRARAAVGLEHVAVDGDRPLAEPAEVDDAAQRAPDEPLDLVRPPADPALGRLAVRALGGGPRQHRVLGRHPARALAAQVRRDAVGDRRRAQHLGVAELDEARALGPFLDAELEADRAQVARPAAVGADAGRSIADGHVVDPLLRLGGIPQLVERREVEVAQGDAALGGLALHAAEPSPELGVGGADGGLRLDAALARDVDEHEQQVAELLGPGRRVGVVGGLAQLVGLLDDLVEDALERRPVVAEVGGPLLHLLAGGERRQRRRDAVERARSARSRRRRLGLAASAPASARSSALIRSHWRFTSDAVRASASPKTCGWRRTIFVRDRGLDVGQVEDAGLGGELGMEHDLEQQVAELAGQRRRGPGLERVVDLVRLLEQVLAQRRVGLLAVPRAAVRARAAGR